MDRKSFKKGALVGVLAMCVLFALILVGTGVLAGVFRAVLGIKGSPSSQNASEVKTDQKLEVLDRLVDQYYLYEDDIDNDRQREGIYKGFIEALDDPYSMYQDKEMTDSLLEDEQGEYCGIGAVLQQDEETELVVINSVYKNSPAEKAGLKSEDLIVKVDDKEVEGKDLNEVVKWIRGEKGTKVKITVGRKNSLDQYDKVELTAVRDKIEIVAVEYKMLADKVGYIRVSEFEGKVEDQFEKAVKDLDGQGARGLVVDLRNNPGGDVDAVCYMLDLLLPKGTVVYTKDKNGNRLDEKSDDEHQYKHPVNVLVNGNSASASEIFTGAIQDYGLGKIVGTTTYGKGVVQQIFDLKDGTSLRLTVEEYFTPKGRNIHKKGIKPDVEVEAGENDVAGDPATDAQLKKAIEVLD